MVRPASDADLRRTILTEMTRLAAVVLLGALGSACVTTRAPKPIERPALEVPPVPPRVIEPAPLPEITQLEPVSDLPPPPVDAKPVARRPGREPASSNNSKEKPVAAPAEPPPPVEPPPQPAQPPQNTPPAPVLRTPATADAAATERQIREALNRAQGILNHVDFRRLSDERKAVYNEVKDFLVQAEVAIKESNFELAKGLASSAEKLANGLR
jgi:flavin-binding protein dodecin